MDRNWVELVSGTTAATGTLLGFTALKEARGPRYGITIVVSRLIGISFSTQRVKTYLS
jgi:hypothetical protein